MKRIAVLPSFERTLKKLSSQEKAKLRKVLEQLNAFLEKGVASKGLGFKKINKDKYELRVDKRLRVVMKAERDTLYLVLVGNHDDVKAYLKKYR